MSRDRPLPSAKRDRFVTASLFAFLLFEVLAGPLRYYLSAVGLAPLVYLPKALLICSIIWCVLPGVLSGRGNAELAITLACVAFYVGVGIVYTGTVAQALFGLFSLVPLAGAFVAEPAIRKLRYSIVNYGMLLWSVVTIGILLDFATAVPWTGASYELGGMEVSGSREWQTYGVERVSGFSRASYSAADQIFALAIVVSTLGKNVYQRVLVWLLSGALILITTTKTTFGAYALATPLLLIVCIPGAKLGITQLTKIGAPVLAGLVCIALPLSIFFVDYRAADATGTVALMLFSFEERLTWMWPEGFELVERHGNLLLGRGMGGFGAAQSYYEPKLSTAGDNLFVYLYGTCGVGAVVILVAYVYRCAKLDVNLPWDRVIWMLSFAALTIGWAITALEEPFVATMFGVTYAYARLDGGLNA